MIKAASLFSQILSTIRTAANFDNLVAKHEAEKNAKGFESKTQLVSMLFCHLAKADSLREIVNGLACCNGMMSHIGLKKAHPPLLSLLCHKQATDEAVSRVESFA
ncbi:MAG TPA: DUF4372 domain-containing protein [Synergistales bacterium]|nr:DUF4372 domain-containing protein [Synergistales bacterium]